MLPWLAPGGGCVCAYEKLRCETLPSCFRGASSFVCLGKNQSILRRVVQGTTRQQAKKIADQVPDLSGMAGVIS